MKTIIIFFFILRAISISNLFAQSIQYDHEANSIKGLLNLKIVNRKLSFEASSETDAFIVIRNNKPTKLKSAENTTAILSPGWDGTLGYSLYGLELKITKPGPVEIKFDVSEPPAQPIRASDQDTRQFKNKLDARLSRFPEGKTAFNKWKTGYRDSLQLKLMGRMKPERVHLETRLNSKKEYENFWLYEYSYQTQTDRRNIALISIPKDTDNPPLLVATHGHETTWGKADTAAFEYGHIDDFCAYFANRGWAVLQPATMDHHLQHPGWTLQGEWTWDAMVAIDMALKHTSIDKNRIAVCGLSTGGHLSMNLLALDDRIKAGVVGCILSTWNHYEKRFRIPPHCDCGIHQQLSPLFEQCDWAALAVPKPVQFQHGTQDASFCPKADEKLLDLDWNIGILPLAEYDTQFDEIERAYGIYQSNENVTTVYHDGPHSVNNEKAYLWLSKAIQSK